MLGVSSCHHGKAEDVAQRRRDKVTVSVTEEAEGRQKKQVMIKEERKK